MVQGVDAPAQRLRPVLSVDDELRQHRVELGRHQVPFVGAGVDPDALSRRLELVVARAVELRLGALGPDDIEIVTANDESRSLAESLRKILAA